MKDKIIWSAVCLVVGIVIGFLFLHKTPDVEYKHDKIFAASHSTGTTTLTIHDTALITGATTVSHHANGDTVASGTNLSINTNTNTASTIVTEVHIEYKEVLVDKIINYTAFVGLGTNPFNLPEINAQGGIKILGPVWLSDTSCYDFKTGIFKTGLTALYFF